uniref:Bardet-Biedl syndrome 12 n=1 Tax=Tetraodon nigroviridis TaxID=99883 RepID=H3D6A2_TETNG
EMLGSRIIKHQQQVGLQELCVLAQVSHSFLGPNKNYKFIQDDTTGESALVASCFRIFENLELSCAVGQLVNETVQAHHRVCHTGSGCLLFLAGTWSRAALECLQRGISPGSVVSAMSEGMDICLEVCKKSSIPIKTLTAKQPENFLMTSSGLGASVKASRCPRQQPRGPGLKGLKLSRHFCDSLSETVSALEHSDILHMAEGLSHGCVDAMNLVIRAYQTQSEKNQDISSLAFDVSKVVTCVLPGLPEDHACVLQGCVLLLSAEQSSVARRLQEQRLKVALITGDLADTYRHLGFNKHVGLRCVSDHLGSTSSNKEEEWLEKVETLLSKLEVNLILVSGRVSENVLLRFCRCRILVVEKVKVSILKAFADATGAVPVTYATQLSQLCVGIGASVAAWREVVRPDGNPWSAVNISADGNAGLVTAVLTGCVCAKLQALEDQFWACAYRLHHALRDRVLLLGAGATEMLCAQRLRKHAEGLVRHPGNGEAAAGAANPYRGVVLHLMAEGFMDYVSALMVNAGRFSKVGARTELNRLLKDCSEGLDMSAAMSELLSDSKEGRGDDAPSSKIYDSLSVKQEAWRRALDVVLLVLQADAEVITG